MKQIYTVPDASCEHCKMRIESALKASPAVDNAELDLAKKEVYVEGSIERGEAIRLIDEAGYDAFSKEAG